MREQSPFARRSLGREQHRTFYATYITSQQWRDRRTLWAATETARLAPAVLSCVGCDDRWRLSHDDLHHCDYARLGAEADDDLWPLCRACHDQLHAILDAVPAYRKMKKRHANTLALAALRSSTKTGNGDHGIAALLAAL